MDELMLKVENVSKQYVLGQIGSTTLREELQRWSARMHGREDPTKKIGTREYTAGETFLALNGVSFDVKKGERVGIIGHNGAGKTTLLKLISRVTAPTKGRIGLNGRVASMLEVGTGFHGELTGRENIYMNGAILGMKKKEIDDKVEDIIDFSECRQFIDTPVKRYSSGMYVKLAFAVAAHLDAEIMIMDEVLAVGDMAFQKKCIEKMSSVSKTQGRTILYVGHNMNVIRQLCDRCIVLDHGRLIYDGEVEEAVAIYLNNIIEVQQSYVELSDLERLRSSTNRVHMQSIHFLDECNGRYLRGVPVRFAIRWSSKSDIHDVRFRVMIRYIDDTPVGMAQSPIIGSFYNGSEEETEFELSTEYLAEGKYYFSISFFIQDKLGNIVNLDHIPRAFSIELLSDPTEEGQLNWKHKWWGSVVFPDMKVIE